MQESVTFAIPVGLKVFPTSMPSQISVNDIKIGTLNALLIFHQQLMVMNDS